MQRGIKNKQIIWQSRAKDDGIDGKSGWFVDSAGLPEDDLPPYYDLGGNTANRVIRTDKELTIIDNPTADLTGKFFRQVWEFHTYLVIDGKAYYEVTWKREAMKQDDGTVKESYPAKSISGGPIGKLPEFATGKQLFGGYYNKKENDENVPDMDKPIEYKNPLAK